MAEHDNAIAVEVVVIVWIDTADGGFESWGWGDADDVVAGGQIAKLVFASIRRAEDGCNEVAFIVFGWQHVRIEELQLGTGDAGLAWVLEAVVIDVQPDQIAEAKGWADVACVPGHIVFTWLQHSGDGQASVWICITICGIIGACIGQAEFASVNQVSREAETVGAGL